MNPHYESNFRVVCCGCLQLFRLCRCSETADKTQAEMQASVVMGSTPVTENKRKQTDTELNAGGGMATDTEEPLEDVDDGRVP